jgi:hypothetical protein
VQRILTRSPSLRARIEHARIESPTLFDETRIVWTPEPERISRVVLKNARGHAYFEYGEPMLDNPSRVWFAPLEGLRLEERAEFEDVEGGHLWPEVGSRMLTRALTGQDLVIQNYLATEVLWDD